MSKTVTVPISSLRHWKGSKAVTPDQPLCPVAEAPAVSDELIRDRLRRISAELRSVNNTEESVKELFSQMEIEGATDFSTEISVESLSNMWRSGKLQETPEQTASVEKTLRKMLDNENISHEEKELWMTGSRTEIGTK